MYYALSRINGRFNVQATDSPAKTYVYSTASPNSYHKPKAYLISMRVQQQQSEEEKLLKTRSNEKKSVTLGHLLFLQHAIPTINNDNSRIING